MDLGETSLAPGIRYLVIPPAGGGYAGGIFRVDGDIHLQAPEYSHAIHLNMINSGPLPGGGVQAGIAGLQEVVLLGGILF